MIANVTSLSVNPMFLRHDLLIELGRLEAAMRDIRGYAAMPVSEAAQDVQHSADGSAFYALALWDSPEGAGAFFEEWQIEAEADEEAIVLEGDVGLVPFP